jgi:hypothetical protein
MAAGRANAEALARAPRAARRAGFMLEGDSNRPVRVREAMSRYFRQKLWEALHELIGDCLQFVEPLASVAAQGLVIGYALGEQ